MIRHPHTPLQPHGLVTWLSSSSLLLVVWLAMSQAQVRTTTLTSDGTLGTTVTQNGNLYTITGGTRPGSGPNLFHSFDRFSVGTGDTASFTGPTGIANILSRVTGGQRSDIDGTLHSEMPGAHLFLLNPSGVLFGPNARLDVGGSFHVSTADFLRFTDGATFSAHVGEKSTLTVAAPAAFGFLGLTPGPIMMQGSVLKVPAGQTISVVGGDITLVGNGATSSANPGPTLGAPGGRIQLVSVASPGEVGVDRVASAPDLRMEGFTRLGRIDLSQGAVATVGSGENQNRNAGEIAVRGGQLTLTGGSQFDASTQGTGRGGTVTVQVTEAMMVTGANSGLTTSTSSAGDAGRIEITAPRVDMQEGADIQARANSKSPGNAGVIVMQVGTLTLSGGDPNRAPSISTETTGPGHAGKIMVQATEAITLAGPSSRIVSNSQDNLGNEGNAGQIVVTAPVLDIRGNFAGIRAGTFGRDNRGNAGDIRVEVGTLTLTDGAVIGSSTQGTGQGGTITVRATEASIRGRGSREISRLDSSTNGRGNAGVIRVEVGTLTLGAMITSSSNSSMDDSDAGRIEITAPRVDMQEGADIQARANRISRGNGGAIVMQVGTLTLTGGDPARAPTISTEITGPGEGGTITVQATEAITLAGPSSRIVSNSLASASGGNAGRIVVTAPVLDIRGDFAGIRTSAFAGRGSGNAGDIRVEVGTLTLTDGAVISSSIDSAGQGGTITVRATEASIRGRGSREISRLDSSSGRGGGKAGDIRVEVGTLTLTDGATIRSRTMGAGSAGNITLNVGSLMAQGATLTSSSTEAATGNAGTILIQGPGGMGTTATQVTLTGSVVATEASVADGGDIQVRARDMLRLRDSQITTAVRSGQGRGGNILIDPNFVILERSQIVANAFGGPGGKIRIVAQGFVPDAASHVSASSAQDVNGIVDIQAFITPSGLVAPFPLGFASAVSLLRSSCAARLHEGTVSTLVERGRAGLPATPDGVLPSRLPLAPLDTVPPTHDGGLPSAALLGPLGGSQGDPSESLPLQGRAVPAGSLRLLGDCAAR